MTASPIGGATWGQAIQGWAISALLAGTSPAVAASPSCQQAEAIVDEVKAEYAAGQPDHGKILRRLATARDLCPSLGSAWKYSYCSASAMGDSSQARIFERRAAFNRVKDLTCPIGGEAAPERSRAPLGPVRNKFALVVGVSRFADSTIPQLRFAAKDARDFATALADPCLGRFPRENVRLLADAEATRANVLEALNSIILQAQEDDLVLLFFSTHGSPAREEDGLRGIGYLVTYDTELARPWVNGLEFQDLRQKADLIKARRLITFLDSCYSGQVRGDGSKDLLLDVGGITPQDAKLLLSGEGSYVISSSAETERSWESEALQNGFFTYYLIDAMRRQGGSPTLDEVFDHLARRVPAAVAREKGARQTPQIFPEDPEADLRIGVVPSAAGAAVPVCAGRPGQALAPAQTDDHGSPTR